MKRNDLKINTPKTYYVELLFNEIPRINFSFLENEIKKINIITEVTNNTDEVFSISFPKLGWYSEELNTYPQCVFLKKTNKANYSNYLNLSKQTLDWKDMKKTIQDIKYKLIFSDFLFTEIDNLTRITIFNTILKLILKNSNCTGVFLPFSLRLISPIKFIEILETNSENSYLYGALNIRINTINKFYREYVLDTIGLTAFNLRDFQCHFKNLNIKDVSNILTRCSYYVFEKGNIIMNNDYINGIKEESKWKCSFEESLVLPRRSVIDIEPEQEFSAGKRV